MQMTDEMNEIEMNEMNEIYQRRAWLARMK